MNALSLVARIRIPVSGDLANVLAVIGGIAMVATVLFFAWAKVKEDGARGWMWMGGSLLFLLGSFAAVLLMGHMGEPDGRYYPMAAAVGILGLGSSSLMLRSAHFGGAFWFALLFALVTIAKLVFRWPFTLVQASGTEEIRFYPASITDPRILIVIVLTVLFTGMALTARKRRARGK